MFSSLVENDDQNNMMREIWQQEVEINENRARDTWLRNERFLNKKKYEDEQRNVSVLADITWEEKLRSNDKQKSRNVNQGYHHAPSYITSQFPPYYYQSQDPRALHSTSTSPAERRS